MMGSVSEKKSSEVAVYLPRIEPFSPVFGGALAKWTHKVYPFIRNDYQATVYAPENADTYSSLAVMGQKPPCLVESLARKLENRDLRGLLRPLNRLLAQAYQRSVAKTLATKSYDIVHIHNDLLAAQAIRRSCPNAKIVLHMNNNHLVEAHAIRSGIGEAALKSSDLVAFCSQYILRCAEKEYSSILKEKACVIPNGADQRLPKQRMIEADGGLNGSIRLLFVGRLVPDKGLHILLDALELLLPTSPHLCLTVVGGAGFGEIVPTDYVRMLWERAEKLGGRVTFTGPVPQNLTDSYFETSDIFVCPSLWEEPLGLVNLEAMSHSLPVIGFARGGIPEALGDAGRVVTETTAAALADAIRELVISPSLLKRCGEACFDRFSRHFTWQNVAAEWSTILGRL